MINYEFLSSEREKKQLAKIYTENEKRIADGQDVYKIFQGRQEEKNTNINTNQELIIYKKENFFTKIVKKLKSSFRISRDKGDGP